MTIAPTGNSNSGYFGVKGSSWASADSLYVYRSDNYFRLDWIGSQTKSFIPTLNTVYRFDCCGNKVSIDGGIYAGSQTKSSTASTKTFWLMAVNGNGTAGVPQRFYGAQFYEDGKTLSANYVPCTKDGVAGVYETISGTILYSASSTALTAGPEITSSSVKTFTGAGGDLAWTTSANWLPDGAPSATDDVKILSGRTALASGALAVKSLDIAAGGALYHGCKVGEKLTHGNANIFPTSDTGSQTLATTGDFTLKGLYALGGVTNIYDAVSVTVGGAFTASARSRASLFARYGDTATAWNAFTWSDFRTGGGVFTVTGKTTLADSAIVYPAANKMSGLPFVFTLADLEIGESAAINAKDLGWGKVGTTWYGKGYSSSGGGSYGGKGGGSSVATYGYANAPFYPGSPGSGNYMGGGAIRIAAQDIILNGTLTATSSNVGGGTVGSGGGIFVTCRELTLGANALVNAKGADNTGNDSVYQSGGGGRIAIVKNSPFDAQIASLYETGSATDVEILSSSLMTDATSPYPTSAFNVTGGHQACYATNPTQGGHGKDGSAVLLAARAEGEIFITVTSDRTPVTTVPALGRAAHQAGEIDFSFPEAIVDANDPAIRYLFTNVELIQNDAVVETVTDLTFKRNLAADTTVAAHYQTTQYRCRFASGGVASDRTEWVTSGATFSCTAAAVSGCEFLGWRGATNEAATVTTVSLTADHPLVIAAFYRPTGSLAANIWNGEGDGATWDDKDNWSLDRVPGPGDAVTVGAGADVLVANVAFAGSLTLSDGAWLRVASSGTSISSANNQLPVTAVSREALGIYVAGDCAISGATAVLGGYRNYADDVRLEIGGDMTMSGAAALVVNARYGAANKSVKAWKTFTYADFQKGGASVIVSGETTLSDTAKIYPTSNARSGLSPVFELQDLSVGATAAFNARSRGWAYVTEDNVHYGLGAKSSQYGGAHGGNGGVHNSGTGARNSNTYGEPLAPFRPGSPSYYSNEILSGGGAICIRCADFALGGSLDASSDDMDRVGGTGSGGSIFVICDKLTPGAASSLKAIGGNATGYDYGCGGGGRIAIIVGGLETDQLDDLYATGECENIIVVLDNHTNATDKAIYPNTIGVEGGHGGGWATNPNYATHGLTGSFRWVQNRGNSVLITIDAGLDGVTVTPNAGTDTFDKGDLTFTAPESVADPVYPTTGRYAVQGLVWSNATEGVEHVETGASVELDITADTWVTWRWGNREFLLTVDTIGPGATAGSGWKNENAVIELTAQPQSGASFAYWAGDIDEADRKKSSITVTMDRPKTVRAVYARATPVAAIWKGAEKGDWFDAANWENEMVPTAQDTALMTNGTAFVRDAAEIELAELTLSGNAKLYIGSTGTTVRTCLPFDATLTNRWRLAVAGDFVLTNGAQFVLGGHKALAECELSAGNLYLYKGAKAGIFAGRHGESTDLATFKDGGARVTVGEAFTLDGSGTSFMVFNHYESGAPVIISSRTFSLTGSAVIDADYNGWGRLERYVNGTWSPVLYGLGVPIGKYGEYGRAGSSYGGKGGLAQTSTVYGYETAPFYPGSPVYDLTTGTHYQYGGGSVRLKIEKKAYIDSTIRACGSGPYSQEDHGGSSGGAIWLTARWVKFGPSAKFDVHGGAGGSYKDSSGGGGGRIAIGVNLDETRLDALYATGAAEGITVSPLEDNGKYLAVVNVDGGTCTHYNEGSKDGGDGSAVLVEGPKPGIAIIIR